MSDVASDQLKRVIESQHGGTATHVQSVQIVAVGDKKAHWDGIVHVFDLKGHPIAQRAYAWSSSIQGGTASRYFAVLHQGRISGPVQAVKAAAGMIQKLG